jgi:hypothetical protein
MSKSTETTGERKIILQLCADTGSDTKPYRDAGYDVILVGKDIGVENYHPPKNVHGIIANPVCTEFSTARSNGRARNPEEGMKLVRECQRIIEEANPVWWVIENPATGRLKDFLGEPVMTYEPWNFGSPWTKKTALWGKFVKPIKQYVRWEDVPKLKGLYTRPGRGKPSLAFMHKSHAKLIPEFHYFNPKSDMEFRSLCSQNFAQAFYRANK